MYIGIPMRYTLVMTTREGDKMTGYRFVASWDVENAPKVGDRLPSSYVWDGDKQTDEKLDGTCAFETRAAVEKYAENSHGRGWIVEIEGEHAGSGDLAYEVIIADAVVTAVENW